MSEHQQTQQSTESKTTFQKQATPIIQTPLSNPYNIIQRARINPKSLTHADVMQLQRTIGNRAVGRLFSEIGLIPSTAKPVQRQEIPEEEEPLQGKFENKHEIACPSCFAAPILQRQEIPEEEEPLQGKMIETIQRQEIPEEEEPLQGKFESIQRQEIPEEEEPLQTKRENNTGMPDNLKAGVESLSGIDMNDVRVHYNSDKPADVGALAYTQGSDIHVAPGQEMHLPHEAWHVVQQKHGRVKPTTLAKGVPINDDTALEYEADVMGERSVQMKQQPQQILKQKPNAKTASSMARDLVIQKMKVNGIDVQSTLTGETRNKHVEADVGNMKKRADSEYGSRTFVTNENNITRVVNGNDHNFPASPGSSDRFDFNANVQIYQFDKTPPNLGKGQQAIGTINGVETECTIGTYKDGNNQIKVSHFMKRA